MSLFWYPSLNSRTDIFDTKFDKEEMLNSYMLYYLARLQSMFKYENLPDTIPVYWLEHYLLTNGNCLIIKHNEKLYAVTGGEGSIPNAYYIPSRYIVANPYLNNGLVPEKDSVESTFSKTFVIDGDSVLIRNDTYSQGVLPMLKRYLSNLVENDITMNIADVLARATIAISAADDNTKASAELWLKRLRDGNLGILGDNKFLESLNMHEFKEVASTLIPLIEYHQYLKASLYNELGLNSNYNMKRESINSNESQLNDDMLHPLIDDMLRHRQEGIDKVNTMFGTDIKVSFNSAWEANEIEEAASIENLEAAAVANEAEAIAIVSSITEESEPTNNADIDNNNSDSDTDMDNSDNVEATSDQAEEAPSEEVDIEEVKEDIEDIKEVFDDLIEDESEDTEVEEDDNEKN